MPMPKPPKKFGREKFILAQVISAAAIAVDSANCVNEQDGYPVEATNEDKNYVNDVARLVAQQCDPQQLDNLVEIAKKAYKIRLSGEW